MFANIKLEDLKLDFNLKFYSKTEPAFGPPHEIPTHLNEMFDGKIFKPYSKKEKLGKLCEFTFVPTGGGAMAPSTANSLQMNKNMITQSNAEIV